MVGESHDAVIGEKLSLSQSTSTERMAHGAFKNLLVYSALGSIPARMLAPTLQLSNTLIKREKLQTRRGFNFKNRAQVRGGGRVGGDVWREGISLLTFIVTLHPRMSNLSNSGQLCCKRHKIAGL
jgi:hypothetical protein